MVSLAPILPPKAREKLGTRDTGDCYSAAFPFNDPNYRPGPEFFKYFRSTITR
ncbi:MAG: hypothetical protein R3B54_00850 [Bdellovibrionota bacterium]